MHLMHSPSVALCSRQQRAVAPTTMCKVKLSVWCLVKMSGPTGQHRAPSQRLTNLHSSFYRVGAQPEIHATYPNTTTTMLVLINTDQHAAKAQENRGWRILCTSVTLTPLYWRRTGQVVSPAPRFQTDHRTEWYWQSFPPRSVEKPQRPFH